MKDLPYGFVGLQLFWLCGKHKSNFAAKTFRHRYWWFLQIALAGSTKNKNAPMKKFTLKNFEMGFAKASTSACVSNAIVTPKQSARKASLNLQHTLLPTMITLLKKSLDYFLQTSTTCMR